MDPGYIAGGFWQLLRAPITPTHNFYWPYLIAFVVIAGLVFVFTRARKAGGPVAFLRWCFPPAVYLHPSAFQDYWIVLLGPLFLPLILFFNVVSRTFVAEYTLDRLAGRFGAPEGGPWGIPTVLAYTVGLSLATDLALYIVHRVHHRVGILWPFHAVHHSAQVLTPVTLLRKHPVWNAIVNPVNQAFVGVFQGVFVFAFFGDAHAYALLGINAVYAVYNLGGAHLRHSHIWWSWGPVLSRIFISPAMHQIHHSTDPKHIDKNFGEVFALWDWMFRSIYIPSEREALTFGMPGGAPNPHPTLLRLYLQPFADSARAVVDTGRRVLGGRSGGDP